MKMKNPQSTDASRWRKHATIVLFALLSFSPALCAQKKEKLAKNYREWLERDVVYIITKDERENFLKLPSDESRDKFIEQFWQIRNPNPESPTNDFKDEHYKRIEFADSRFGVGSAEEGWRTDRGHVYILLGAPNQKQIFRNSANLYPLEIWFYSTGLPGLPNFFYLMFYDKDSTGDYRFYSPYFDGPDKLVTGVESINDPSTGYRLVMNSLGPEVARVSLSLIPGEPVDASMGTRSMESDILLSSIRGYNNLPAYRNEILRLYKLKESVTTRMLLTGRNLDVLTFPVRDSHGLTRLDYSLHLKNPADMALSKAADGRFAYSVGVTVRVFGPENKLIFSEEKRFSDSMDKHRMEEVSEAVFGAEGLLALPPGKYRLAFELTDWTGKRGFQAEREVVIPQPEATTFIVPAILPFSSAEEVSDPALRDFTPFVMGGVKFHPLSESTPTLRQDAPLQFAYQIWSNPQDPRSLLGQKLMVNYGLGQPAIAGSSTSVKDEVGMEQFDATGSLVTGKRLSLAEKASGNYVLSVAVQRSDNSQKSFATSRFRILEGMEPRKTWEVVVPDLIKDEQDGVLAQERGLALLAVGQPDEARKWLLRSIKLGSSNDQARAALVEAYFMKNDYSAVRSLYTDVGVTSRTDPQTLLRIAESFEKLNDSRKAEILLRDFIGTHPDSGALYLALADIYRQRGDLKSAAESEQKAKSVLGIN